VSRKTRSARLIGYLGAVAAVISSLLLLQILPGLTARSAGPVLLGAVTLVALTWGAGPAFVSAASAIGTYYYFFLEPLGFRAENASDWLAMLTFAATSIVLGELVARAERRHVEAEEGRRQIEHLYQQLEAAFDRASEAEADRRNNQLKSALLDALRHNLRTPLTSIKASVTALLERGEWVGDHALTTESRRELLQIIDEEADRLNRFIEGLSTAGREPEPHDPYPPVAMTEIVQSALRRAETVTRDHRVTVHVDQELPPLAVDAAALVEVLYILLDNATKYSPEGTEIHVSAEPEGQGYLCVEVVDEGPGIPVPLRERVFENFFRIHGREPSDPRRAGAGLGLSIARRLVESQSGRIWIEAPASGRGTAVIMMLPLRAEAEEAVRVQAAS
jgi:two-component system sensor histidine kinase KdpD